ncbi:MAG TPA: hypothetical protein PLF40_24110 [Kofleriaceae bacterium]|nr:hypothetical protein [Kofleriaceae bacterium]
MLSVLGGFRGEIAAAAQTLYGSGIVHGGMKMNRAAFLRSRLIGLMLVAVTALTMMHARSPAHAHGAPLVVRAGANHHLGDDSFVATFGRLPTAADGEKLRMRVHLRYVHDWLAARPATSPALAPQRAQLLAYLEDYIALGITPKNHHVLHRSPVFIDDEGAICAVGYLIERSVGRQLPELIASTYRYDFLETIAAAMPDVAAWVAQSGFTLDELASIQPAYGEPTIIDWRIWNPKEDKVPDGPFEVLTAGGKLSRVRGDMRKKLMEGEWNVFFAGSRSSDSAARAATKPVKIGTGMMKHGAGQWTSFDVAGHKLAEGPFVNNLADGAWRIYHASGNLAAEGKFHRGVRVGAWRFYLDTATPSVLASGSFRKDGMVGGTWKHFDATGSVVATTSYATPPQWGDKALYTDGGEGLQLTFAKTANGFEHAIHQGTIGSFDEGSYSRLETMAVPGLRLYSYRVTFGEAVTVLYDSDGNRLEHSGEPVDGEAATGPWQSSTCDWPKSMRRSAARGQLADLHGLLYREAKRRWKRAQKSNATDDASVTLAPTCTKPQLLSAARAAQLDALLATAASTHIAAPAFVTAQVLEQDANSEFSDDDAERHQRLVAQASHLDEVLDHGMAAWMQWPHIDGLMQRVFDTMPGRSTCSWASMSGEPMRCSTPE